MKAKKVIVSLALVVSLATPTLVLAVSVGGGTWNYGVGWSGDFEYSDYLHNDRYHGSAIRYDKKLVASTNASKGSWANSRYNVFPPTRMEYYWNYGN